MFCGSCLISSEVNGQEGVISRQAKQEELNEARELWIKVVQKSVFGVNEVLPGQGFVITVHE